MPLGQNAIVLVSYQSTYNSQRYLLTHTYRIETTNSGQTPAQDTEDILATMTGTGAADLLTKYRACLGTNVTIDEAVVQGIWPTRFVRRSVGLALGGSMADTADTGNVAGVVTMRTELAGRGQIANKHIGPPGRSGLNTGSISNDLLSALNILGAQLAADVQVALSAAGQSIEMVPVIFHRASGTSNPIDDHIVSGRVGTMRRRTLRVGQ